MIRFLKGALSGVVALALLLAQPAGAASNLKVSIAGASAEANQIQSLAASGYIAIYSGSQPSTPETNALPNWATSTAYTANQVVYDSTSAKVYQETVASCTSASSGNGPSGTGTGISDNTCSWNYVGTTQLSGALISYSSISYGTASSGTITLSGTPLSGSIALTGTASWFRIYKSDGVTAVYDGSVCTSGCDMNFNSVALSSGASLSISSLTFTVPGI